MRVDVDSPLVPEPSQKRIGERADLPPENRPNIGMLPANSKELLPKKGPRVRMLPAGFEPASEARKAPILDRTRLRERKAGLVPNPINAFGNGTPWRSETGNLLDATSFDGGNGPREADDHGIVVFPVRVPRHHRRLVGRPPRRLRAQHGHGGTQHGNPSAPYLPHDVRCRLCND